MVLNDVNSELEKFISMSDCFTIVYIKNKNPHNGKNQTTGYIKKCLPFKYN